MKHESFLIELNLIIFFSRYLCKFTQFRCLSSFLAWPRDEKAQKAKYNFIRIHFKILIKLIFFSLYSYIGSTQVCRIMSLYAYYCTTLGKIFLSVFYFAKQKRDPRSFEIRPYATLTSHLSTCAAQFLLLSFHSSINHGSVVQFINEDRQNYRYL